MASRLAVAMSGRFRRLYPAPRQFDSRSLLCGRVSNLEDVDLP